MDDRTNYTPPTFPYNSTQTFVLWSTSHRQNLLCRLLCHGRRFCGPQRPKLRNVLDMQEVPSVAEAAITGLPKIDKCSSVRSACTEGSETYL